MFCKGRTTGQLDQRFPWFSWILELILFRCPNLRLHSLLLMQISHNYIENSRPNAFPSPALWMLPSQLKSSVQMFGFLPLLHTPTVRFPSPYFLQYPRSALPLACLYQKVERVLLVTFKAVDNPSVMITADLLLLLLLPLFVPFCPSYVILILPQGPYFSEFRTRIL